MSSEKKQSWLRRHAPVALAAAIAGYLVGRIHGGRRARRYVKQRAPQMFLASSPTVAARRENFALEVEGGKLLGKTLLLAEETLDNDTEWTQRYLEEWRRQKDMVPLMTQFSVAQPGESKGQLAELLQREAVRERARRIGVPKVFEEEIIELFCYETLSRYELPVSFDTGCLEFLDQPPGPEQMFQWLLEGFFQKRAAGHEVFQHFSDQQIFTLGRQSLCFLDGLAKRVLELWMDRLDRATAAYVVYRLRAVLTRVRDHAEGRKTR